MDRIFHGTSSWWILVLVSVSTLSESRLATDSHVIPSRTPGSVPPRMTAGQQKQQQQQQQHSAEPGARTRPVAVHCHPDSMRVVVQADMFDTGLQVDGTHLRLGSDPLSEGSACGAAPSGEAEFTLLVHLSDCGTKLSSTRDKIIYSNVLVYAPEPSPEGLLRLDGATIAVECHYEKRYAVDAGPLQPTWIPSVSIASAEDQISFNLRLMTDDWQFERGSYLYFLGDPVHVEVSAVLGNHMPLRVFADHCVATATPDSESTLRYDFIEHYGCLTDAYLTNSSSHFLRRVEDHKLRLRLEAFRFYQESSHQIYLTCHVKAVPVVLTASSPNRACSIIEDRWRSVDGNDQVCRSCDISHRGEDPPSTEPPKTSTKAWPSKTSQQSSVQKGAEHAPANYIRYHPGGQHKHQQSSAGMVKRGAGDNAEQTINLGPISVLPYSRTDTKPSDSKTVLSPKNRTTRDSGRHSGEK